MNAFVISDSESELLDSKESESLVRKGISASKCGRSAGVAEARLNWFCNQTVAALNAFDSSSSESEVSEVSEGSESLTRGGRSGSEVESPEQSASLGKPPLMKVSLFA